MQHITIKIDNEILEGFDKISINRSMENFCANFSFTAFSEKKIILPFNPHDEVEILVNGDLFLTGLLDRVYSGYTSSSHFYSFSGRDRTSIIVDNSMDGKLNFTAPIGLVEIIEILIEDFSVDIAVIPPDEDIENFKQEELSSADEAENLFEFIEKLSRQRGILLRTDETGDIILEKNQGEEYKVKLLNELNGASNNILEASLDRDYSNRYYRYKAFSTTNLSSKIQANINYNINGEYLDSDEFINQDKFIDIQSEISDDGTSNKKRAEWEAKIRAARSKIYTCKLQGFIADQSSGINDFWNANRLITVKDDFLNINEILLIKNVNFNYSNNGGSITALELVNKDAYIITS